MFDKARRVSYILPLFSREEFRDGINKAQMAELVDALASGASDRKVVKVRVLFWAPYASWAGRDI